ncbi:MAG: SurA N-terminal domain-containing protein [Myxococcota bacterium]
MRRLLVVPLLVLLAVGAGAVERIADGVAAQVGSDIVLISEVLETAAPMAMQAQAQGASNEELRQIHADVLEQLIERALIRQVVKRAEIGASDAEVDEAIAGIAAENGITPDQVQQTVESQGMPYSVYRERIRGEIEHAKVLNDVIAASVRVSEGEVRALYDEEIARQPEGGEELELHLIVLAAQGEKPADRAAACGRAEDAHARIAAGEPFEAVARQMSDVNPERGGAQGWVHESMMAGWMRSAAASLEIGQTSSPIETGFGCAIVRVDDRRAFVPLPYEQAKSRLHALLSERQMAAEYQKFVEKIRSQTYVERKGVFAEAGGNAGASGFGEGF